MEVGEAAVFFCHKATASKQKAVVVFFLGTDAAETIHNNTCQSVICGYGDNFNLSSL